MRRLLLGGLFLAAALLLAGIVLAPSLARAGTIGTVAAAVLLLPALVAGAVTGEVVPFWIVATAIQYGIGLLIYALVVGLVFGLVRAVRLARGRLR